MYRTLREAKKHNPEWLTATEIMSLIQAKYGISVHPTNVGRFAKSHNRTTISYIKCWDQTHYKLGHLYNNNDVDFYSWFTFLVFTERGLEIPAQTLELIVILDGLFAGEIGGYHLHHIVPKHAGGTDDANNLIRLSIYQHAIAHKGLYEQFGRHADAWAWRKLLSMCIRPEYQFHES